MAEQLVEALVISLDPTAPKDKIIQAHTFINQVKDEGDALAVIQIGAGFVTQTIATPATWLVSLGNFSDYSQHFGLQLMEHVVKHRWNGCSDEHKSQIKNGLLQLIEQVGNSPVNPKQGFLRKKIAAVVAEIALREWPQRWPDLLPLLSHLSTEAILQITTPQSSPTVLKGHLSIVLSVFHILSEEINDFALNLDKSRKSDLTKGLQESIEMIVPFLAKVMDGLGVIIQQRPESVAGADEILKELLQCLTVYLEWIPFKMIFDGGFLMMLHRLLQHPVFRMSACECLLLIVARKGPPGDRGPMLELIKSFELITMAIPTSFMQTQGIHPADDDYSFLKRLAQLVVTIGKVQLCTLWSGNGVTQTEPENLQMYLNVLAQFLGHKSLLVSSFCLATWQNILKNDLAQKSQTIRAIIPELLNVIFLLLPKPWNAGSGYADEQSKVYARSDFDTDEDVVEFFGHYRHQALEVVRVASFFVPMAALEYGHSMVEVILAQPTPDLQGPLSVVHRYFAIMDVLPLFLGHSALGFKNALVTTPQKCQKHINVVAATLDKVLACKLNNPDTLSSLLGILDAYTAVLGVLPPSYTENIVAAIFSVLQMVDPLASNDDSNEVTPMDKTQRKAAKMVVQLCAKPPPAFLAILERVCVAVQDIARKETTNEMIRRLLSQAILSAGNNLGTFDAQQRFVQQQLQSSINEISSPELSAILADPQKLCEYTGLFKRGQLDAHSRQRNKLVLLFQSLCVAMKGTVGRPFDESQKPSKTPQPSLRGTGGSERGGDGLRYACAEATRAILTPALQMIRIIHNLWIPGVVPTSVLEILQMRKSEIATVMSHTGRVVPDKPIGDDQVWVDRTQLWLLLMREACYKIVETAAKQGVLYETQPLLPLLAQTCFWGLNHATTTHACLFLKMVVTPIVRYAPRQAEGMVMVTEVMTYYYGYISSFLKTMWHQNEQRQLGVPTTQGQSQPGSPVKVSQEVMIAEVMEDSQLRLLTQEVCNHLTSILGGGRSALDGAHLTNTISKKGSLKDMTAPQVMGPIGVAVLAREDTAKPALTIMCDMLTWKNTAPCRMVANVFVTMMPQMKLSPVFDYVLENHLLRACIEGLSNNGQHEECEVALTNLAVAIYMEAIQRQMVSVVSSFQTIPNCDPALFENIGKELRRHPNLNVKTLRNKFRTALAPITGQHVGQVLKRHIKITALPEKLFLASEQKPKTDDEETLAFFFDNSFGD
eukprot:m.169906 g.169906  ORF g.169906 m.169906 type:complete len:1224 (-) comp31595_c0_seq1:50-3721(-)